MADLDAARDLQVTFPVGTRISGHYIAQVCNRSRGAVPIPVDACEMNVIRVGAAGKVRQLRCAAIDNDRQF